MTTYNTYQEAKIANPRMEIYKLEAGFIATNEPQGVSVHKCNPADCCMTVENFLADGHEFVDGDFIIGTSGNFVVVGVDYTVGIANMKSMRDCERYTLRAAALENQMNIDNLATQTPEEKEALDSIKPVHLRDYQKVGKPHAKVEYKKWNFECAWHAIKAFEDGEKLYTKRSHKDFILIDNAQDVIRFLYSIYERIEYDESTQQREERERLEAAYDLYCVWVGNRAGYHAIDFDKWKVEPDFLNKWLRIVDKTNYRKESN